MRQRSLVETAHDEARRTMIIPNDADRAHWDVAHRYATDVLAELESQGRRDFRRLIVVCGIILAMLALALWASRAHAADNGHYAAQDPALHAWFNGLASGKGLCCSFADGQQINDVDWDTKDGHYRVHLNGIWVVIPDDAVVTVPNKFGAAVVWPYSDADGTTKIRCFLPGGGA